MCKKQLPTFLFWGDAKRKMTTDYILLTLTTSNFIGIVFARTLHYQFYCWYYHSLPYLVWVSFSSSTATSVSKGGDGPLSIVISDHVKKALVLMAVEYSFNKYPATPLSSFILQISHFIVLVRLLCMTESQFPTIFESSSANSTSPEVVVVEKPSHEEKPSHYLRKDQNNDDEKNDLFPEPSTTQQELPKPKPKRQIVMI